MLVYLDSMSLYEGVFASKSGLDPSGLQVDLNLFPSSEEISDSANKTPSSPEFDVGAHGNSSTVVDSQGNALTPQQLAQQIQGAGWQQGQTVKLMSCNTGKGQYAQELANTLGTTVQAPNNFVWYWPNGNTAVAPFGQDGQPDMGNQGGYTDFFPQQGAGTSTAPATGGSVTTTPGTSNGGNGSGP
jgi:hypothetical protein